MNIYKRMKISRTAVATAHGQWPMAKEPGPHSDLVLGFSGSRPTPITSNQN